MCLIFSPSVDFLVLEVKNQKEIEIHKGKYVD
jgi:hypothetical protein